MLKIETNIEVPTRSKYGDIADAIKRCNSGDSFVVIANNRRAQETFIRLSAKRLGLKAIIRIVNAATFRVWVIKGK